MQKSETTDLDRQQGSSLETARIRGRCRTTAGRKCFAVDPAKDYCPQANEEVRSLYYRDKRLVQLVVCSKDQAVPEEKC